MKKSALVFMAMLCLGITVFVSCKDKKDDPAPPLPPPPATEVTDRAGQSYKIKTFGTQTWMTENLNYTASAGISSCYGDKADSCTIYGKLYDTTAMKTNPCPNDWHVPTDEEWKTLEKYLGMSASEADLTGYRGTNEGDKLKKDSSVSVGFNAILGGGYATNYGFVGIEGTTAFWTSTKVNSTSGYFGRALDSTSSKILRGNYPNIASVGSRFCIRCIKN